MLLRASVVYDDKLFDEQEKEGRERRKENIECVVDRTGWRYGKAEDIAYFINECFPMLAYYQRDDAAGR